MNEAEEVLDAMVSWQRECIFRVGARGMSFAFPAKRCDNADAQRCWIADRRRELNPYERGGVFKCRCVCHRAT